MMMYDAFTPADRRQNENAGDGRRGVFPVCPYANLECSYAVLISSTDCFCFAPDMGPDYCPSFDIGLEFDDYDV